MVSRGGGLESRVGGILRAEVRGRWVRGRRDTEGLGRWMFLAIVALVCCSNRRV